MLYQGFYFSQAIDISEIRQIANLRSLKKAPKKEFSLKLDQAIFDLNRSQDPENIQKAINQIKEIDKYNIIGLTSNTFDQLQNFNLELIIFYQLQR